MSIQKCNTYESTSSLSLVSITVTKTALRVVAVLMPLQGFTGYKALRNETPVVEVSGSHRQCKIVASLTV